MASYQPISSGKKYTRCHHEPINDSLPAFLCGNLVMLSKNLLLSFAVVFAFRHHITLLNVLHIFLPVVHPRLLCSWGVHDIHVSAVPCLHIRIIHNGVFSCVKVWLYSYQEASSFYYYLSSFALLSSSDDNLTYVNPRVYEKQELPSFAVVSSTVVLSIGSQSAIR